MWKPKAPAKAAPKKTDMNGMGAMTSKNLGASLIATSGIENISNKKTPRWFLKAQPQTRSLMASAPCRLWRN